MSDLIKRLRGGVYGLDRIPLCTEAADAIEARDAELAALRAECERLKAERDDFHMAYRMKCDEETKSLHAECERLRKDAERYRWLRAAGKFVPDMMHRGWALASGYWPDIRSQEHMRCLDAAIDAAMRQEPKA